MADPEIAHLVPIHVTPLSSTALDNTNKLEETSTVSLDEEHTVVDRLNLNSDGYTKRSITFHSASGSLDGRVVRGSAAQETIETAAKAGTTAFIHVIDSPAATVGLHKGWRYEVVFATTGQSFEAGALTTFSISFSVTGTPVEILAT